MAIPYLAKSGIFYRRCCSAVCAAGGKKRAGIGERYLSHFIHIKPYIVLDRANQMQYMVLCFAVFTP